MEKQKILGIKSQIADSIMRFVIENYGETDVMKLYNVWLQSAAPAYNVYLKDIENVKYALMQFEAHTATPLEHLIICRNIEDKI